MKVVHKNRQSLAGEVAEEIVAVLQRAIQARGRASLVLAGGTTYQPIYKALCAYQEALDWKKVVLFFGDERMVPANDPRSNYRLVYNSWLYIFAESSERPVVQRIRGEIDPLEAAEEYTTLLLRQAKREESESGLPYFDLVLLGMGADGHTASLFPAEIPQVLVAGAPVWLTSEIGSPSVVRITLTPESLNQAREVWVVVTGSEKAATLQEVLADGEYQYPISYIEPLGGEKIWITDLVLETF